MWFPFREGTGGKYRPVVIREILEDGGIILYVTSQQHRFDQRGFVELKQWREAGLSKPSAVGAGRALKVSAQSLEESKYIGVVAPADRIEIQMTLELR